MYHIPIYNIDIYTYQISIYNKCTYQISIYNKCTHHIPIYNLCTYHIPIYNVCIYHIPIYNVCTNNIPIYNICTYPIHMYVPHTFLFSPLTGIALRQCLKNQCFTYLRSKNKMQQTRIFHHTAIVQKCYLMDNSVMFYPLNHTQLVHRNIYSEPLCRAYSTRTKHTQSNE
jgi:hypothetical protein